VKDVVIYDMILPMMEEFQNDCCVNETTDLDRCGGYGPKRMPQR
jgi:hypothetical protein